MSGLAELIPVALEKTLAGKLKWTPLSSNVFEATLGDNALRVSEGDPVTSLYLVDKDGTSLEHETWLTLGPPSDRQLEQLLIAARRQALGVDVALDDALKRLIDL